MVGASILAPNAPRHDLAVVVGQVRKAAESGDVPGTVDIGACLERCWVHLEPTAFGLGEARCSPGFEVWSPTRRDEQAVRLNDRAGLEAEHHAIAMRLHGDARVTDEQRDAVRLEVRL